MVSYADKYYKDGCTHAKDSILCVIGGMLNDTKCVPNSEREKAYMEVYEAIVDSYGALFEDWKA